MGKKLALPFPVVKLMVAAMGSNGDGSGRLCLGGTGQRQLLEEKKEEKFLAPSAALKSGAVTMSGKN